MSYSIARVLEAASAGHLPACLDVAHSCAHIFSPPRTVHLCLDVSSDPALALAPQGQREAQLYVGDVFCEHHGVPIEWLSVNYSDTEGELASEWYSKCAEQGEVEVPRLPW